MAMVDEAAYVEIVPELKNFTKQLSADLKQQTRQLQSAMGGPVQEAADDAGQRGGRRLGSSILRGVTKAVAVGGGLVAALGVGKLGKDIAGAASEIQNTTATMTGLLGSAKAAGDTLQRLQRIGRQSPIETSAYVKAGESLAYLGISGKEAEGILKNVGAAIVTAGGTSEQMGSVSDAMLQMVNTGRVFTDHLNRISDAGVPIFSGLAAHFDTNIAHVREMVEAGKVGIDDVLATIQDAEGETFQAMLKASDGASKTFSNQWKIAKDNIVTTLGTALVPVLERVTPVMQNIAASVPAITDTIISGFSRAAGVASMFEEPLRSLGGFIMNVAVPAIVAFGQAVLDRVVPPLRSFGSYIITNIVPVVQRFGQVLFTQIVPAVQSIATALLDTLLPPIKDFGNFLAQNVMPTVIHFASELMNRLGPALQRVATFIRDNQGIIKGLAIALVSVVAVTRAHAAAMKVQAAGGVLSWLAQYLKGIRFVQAATKAWAAVQWLLNAAMRAFPVFMIITLIAAFVGAIVYAWKNSERFRTIVQAVWRGIVAVAQWAWNNVLKPLFNQLVSWFRIGWGYAQQFWKVLQVVWRGVVAVVKWAWSNVILPIFKAYSAYVRLLWRVAQTMAKIIVAAWQWLSRALGAAWGWIKRNVVDRLIAGWRAVQVYTSILRQQVMDRFNQIKSGLGAAASWINRNVVQPIRRFFQSIWNKAIQIKDGVVDTFNAMKNGVGRAFDRIKSAVMRPVRAVIRWINDNLIGNLNKVTSRFGLDIPKIPVPSAGSGGASSSRGSRMSGGLTRNKGGLIPGSGPDRDSVPTITTPGEGVISRKRMRLIAKQAGLSPRQAIGAIHKGLLNPATVMFASQGKPVDVNPGAIGGPFDFIGDIASGAWEGIKSIGSKIGDWLQEGAAFALGHIMTPIVSGVKHVIPGPQIVQEMFTHFLNAAKNAMVSWGKNEDKKAEAAQGAGKLGAGPLFPGGWRRPLSGYTITRGSAGHGYNSIDLAAPLGRAVGAAHAGVVSSVQRLATSYGHHVRINHGGGLSSLYAHLSSITASIGDRVKAGTMIGRVGSTGNSTGPHLHFEILKNGARQEPTNYIRFDAKNGGTLPRGYSTVYNGTGGPERLKPAQAGDGLTVVVNVPNGFVGSPREFQDMLVRTLTDLDRKGRLRGLRSMAASGGR